VTANLDIIDHLSVSSIRRYQECPRRWAVEKLDGQRSRPGVALIKGTAVDRLATENWRQKRQSGQDWTLDEAEEFTEQAFREHVDQQGGRDEVDWGNESFTRALDSSIRLAAGHMRDHARLCTPAGVQVKFSRTLPDGRAFIGFIDAIDQNGDVIDVKTGSRRMPQGDAERDMQATAYAYGLARPITFRWFRVIDAARTTTEIIESTRGQNAVEWFEDVALSVSTLIDAGVFPAHPGWHCANCPVAALCVGSIKA